MSSTSDAKQHSDARKDRRSAAAGWLYLAVACAVAVFAVVWWSVRGGDESASALAVEPAPISSETSAVGPPARVLVVVDRSRATLTGSVPDEGARSQLVRIANDRFGRGNVIDELTVEPGVDLVSGSISIEGVANEDDDAPMLLQQTAGADLGLAAGAFDVEYVVPEFDSSQITLAIDAVPVLVTGVVPDEQVRERVRLSAEAIYGEGGSSVEELTVGPSTMDGALITIAGVTAPGDVRSAGLLAVLEEDFSSATIVDSSEVDVSDEALEVFEEQLKVTLRENPILFSTGTSIITDEGRVNLQVIADRIQSVPGKAVTIVGHTDDTGGQTVNQTISENRALAVKEALIEMGVDGSRLSTFGAGSTEPEVSNSNAENRARNRRIEFRFDRAEG